MKINYEDGDVKAIVGIAFGVSIILGLMYIENRWIEYKKNISEKEANKK